MPTTDEVIEAALTRLDLPAKVSILAGQDMWSLPPRPEIGLASIVMSDGPIGVRGTSWSPGDPAVALPSPTALAATWDPELARRAGRLLGQEARRKGVHVLLAPTVNLHRSPRGGRHFECYSEDPLLTGEIGAAYVTGVQDHGVAAVVKHFVANDTETERMTVDVRVSDRALRELYLAPFEVIVRRAGVWGVMAAYNGVNGTTMTEHAALLRDVLEEEWGFDGVVISDWTAARSTAATALGGLDIAMPHLTNPWGPPLVAAVRTGGVAEEIIDEMVRRTLRLAARVGALAGASPAVAAADRPAPVDGAAFARKLAGRSMVLASNRPGILPLRRAELRRVAVLGAAARDARVMGGGSAEVYPPYVVSPWDGLAAALPPEAVLTFAVGADPRTRLSPASAPQWTNLAAVFRDRTGAVRHTEPVALGRLRWVGSLPGGVDLAEVATVDLVGRLDPAVGGTHQLGIRGIGAFTLTVAGKEVFDDVVMPSASERSSEASDAAGSSAGDDPATAFLSPPERRVEVPLVAGGAVDVALRYAVPEGLPMVAFTLGYAEPAADPDELLAEAVRVAADADVAIIVVATTEEVESEGFDRATLALPGRQDELVRRVAEVNARTVVVVNAGAPVLLPWIDDVEAVLLTWFPGQEAGHALADVLFGAVEPGGRLPTTWPRRAEDCPVLAVEPVGGILAYDEDVFLGYRGWERLAVAPLFPFGHGLGYTTWRYESLVIERDEAAVTVRNTGERAGREVVQVYIGPAEPDPRRPARWLAGFAVAVAEPDEAVTLRVPLPERAFQMWDTATVSWRTVPGSYRVEAAHDLADPRLAAHVTLPAPT